VAAIREFAPAKVNLTLEVAGRRDDGFHEIASLVAFASVGDVVTLDATGPRGVSVSGPFADALAGENVLARTLDLVGREWPQLPLGAVHLDKQLPVAAGIGGGSADAGALLRALRHTSDPGAGAVDWRAVASRLGADVAACLESRALWMTGTGDRIEDLPVALAPLHAVLVNPMADVPSDKTAQVYRGLGAGAVRAGYTPPAPPALADRTALIDFMRARGNALTRAALGVVPEAGAVLALLSGQADVDYVALSGGGPTCFGVFPDQGSAAAARDRIAAMQPGWWAVAVTLG
jgi:4-diphosphocytidyl-2-C-methyl-D-erythritol kinase